MKAASSSLPTACISRGEKIQGKVPFPSVLGKIWVFCFFVFLAGTGDDAHMNSREGFGGWQDAASPCSVLASLLQKKKEKKKKTQLKKHGEISSLYLLVPKKQRKQGGHVTATADLHLHCRFRGHLREKLLVLQRRAAQGMAAPCAGSGQN